MSADFRFPSAEQRTAMRAAPGLALPLPAGNPAPLAMPAADFVLVLPALSVLPDLGACERAEALAPAASPSGDAEAPAGALSVSELPLAAFDRPSSDPGEQGGGERESPPIGAPIASSSAAVGVPVQAMEAVMIERMKHFDHGHDVATDVATLADNPLKLSRRAERFITFAIEDLQFHRPGHRARAKHHIAQAAAMLLAFYDAVDAEDEHDGL